MQGQRSILVSFIVIAALSFLVSCKEKPTDPEIQTVAIPVFNPTGDTYTSTQTVSNTCDTNGASIRYTTRLHFELEHRIYPVGPPDLSGFSDDETTKGTPMHRINPAVRPDKSGVPVRLTLVFR